MELNYDFDPAKLQAAREVVRGIPDSFMQTLSRDAPVDIDAAIVASQGYGVCFQSTCTMEFVRCLLERLCENPKPFLKVECATVRSGNPWESDRSCPATMTFDLVLHTRHKPLAEKLLQLDRRFELQSGAWLLIHASEQNYGQTYTLLSSWFFHAQVAGFTLSHKPEEEAPQPVLFQLPTTTFYLFWQAAKAAQRSREWELVKRLLNAAISAFDPKSDSMVQLSYVFMLLSQTKESPEEEIETALKAVDCAMKAGADAAIADANLFVANVYYKNGKSFQSLGYMKAALDIHYNRDDIEAMKAISDLAIERFARANLKASQEG